MFTEKTNPQLHKDNDSQQLSSCKPHNQNWDLNYYD